MKDNGALHHKDEFNTVNQLIHVSSLLMGSAFSLFLIITSDTKYNEEKKYNEVLRNSWEACLENMWIS